MKKNPVWLSLAFACLFLLSGLLVMSAQAAHPKVQSRSPTLRPSTHDNSNVTLTSNSPVQIPKPIYFTATVTGTAPFSCTWDFDDSELFTHSAVTNTFTVSHRYFYAGIYSVSLQITDAVGADLSGTIRVEAVCYSLTVELTNSGSSQAGIPALFTATVTGGEPPYSYTWNFGDQTSPVSGTTSQNVISARHPYGAGTHTATFVVTDVHRCSSPVAQTTVEILNTRRYLPVVLKLYSPPLPPSPLVNGGFETGNLEGWNSGGALPVSVVSDNVYSGTWAALLGNPAYGDGHTGNIPVGSAWLSQPITIPAGFKGRLSLAYRMQGYDGLNTDHFLACIKNVATSQQACFVSASFSEYAGPFKDSGWLTATQLITPTWQTVEVLLQHSNEIDGYWNTWTYVDEVRVSLER